MTTTMSALLVSLKDNGDHDNDNHNYNYDHDNDNCENMMMIKIYTEMRIN